jgi:hypothetical protein
VTVAGRPRALLHRLCVQRPGPSLLRPGPPRRGHTLPLLPQNRGRIVRRPAPAEHLRQVRGRGAFASGVSRADLSIGKRLAIKACIRMPESRDARPQASWRSARGSRGDDIPHRLPKSAHDAKPDGGRPGHDHRCPFLGPRLVDERGSAGRRVRGYIASPRRRWIIERRGNDLAPRSRSVSWWAITDLVKALQTLR